MLYYLFIYGSGDIQVNIDDWNAMDICLPTASGFVQQVWKE
jgi:hypothetical protein